MRVRTSVVDSPEIGLKGGSMHERLLIRLLRDAENGGALVEFALVLPFLLLVVTGITTFGLALSNYLTLTDAVSIGGRLLGVSRGQYTDPCLTAATAVQGAAPNFIPASLSFTFVLNGTSYGPYAGDKTPMCSSASTTTGAAGNLVQGKDARISVTYPCKLAVFGIDYAPSCMLTSQVTELVQ
jgi:Flp pilus assembly protein TadG